MVAQMQKKIIRFEDFLNGENGKRVALQYRIGGGSFTLSIVGQESEGFSPKTTTIKLLGKNPVQCACGDVLLADNERLIEMPDGPGRRRFVKFELMGDGGLAAEKGRGD